MAMIQPQASATLTSSPKTIPNVSPPLCVRWDFLMGAPTVLMIVPGLQLMFIYFEDYRLDVFILHTRRKPLCAEDVSDSTRSHTFLWSTIPSGFSGTPSPYPVLVRRLRHI